MYVSMYLCIYVRIYVSMYLCTYLCIYVRIYVSICIYVCIHVSMYLCNYVSMYLCIYVSVYLCIYVWFHLGYRVLYSTVKYPGYNLVNTGMYREVRTLSFGCLLYSSECLSLLQLKQQLERLWLSMASLTPTSVHSKFNTYMYIRTYVEMSSVACVSTCTVLSRIAAVSFRRRVSF